MLYMESYILCPYEKNKKCDVNKYLISNKSNAFKRGSCIGYAPATKIH